ncbi:isopentenyl-diphosphate Delta-isomerase [Roseivivax sp. CAU 1761]
MSDAPEIEIPAWIDGRLQPVEKLAVHRRGLRHKAVSVFVLKGDLVLLQRRALGKYHTPGLWANACCTHPHWNEPPEACARRRLAEELGVAGLSLTPRDRVEYRAEVGDGLVEHEVVDLFTAEADADLALSPDPAEVMETAWMPLAELRRDAAARPGRYTPWLRIYLAEHAARIFPAALLD